MKGCFFTRFLGFGILCALLHALFFSFAVYAVTAQDREQKAHTDLAKRESAEIDWKILEDGLEFAEVSLQQAPSSLAILRIDPDQFEFILCSAREDESAPKTLATWASEKNLAAVINASMYLPDNRTSTGYMRNGIYVNNGQIVKRFGAFFVAGPRKRGLPPAAIIDRERSNWRELLNDYHLVIQNYRMVNSDRRILWAEGGPQYAISAIAQAGDGKILFLHSRSPVDAWNFSRELLGLPLDVRTVMYVEGGPQAGLVINSGDIHEEMGAPHAPSFIATGNLRAVLPNALGIRHKAPERDR